MAAMTMPVLRARLRRAYYVIGALTAASILQLIVIANLIWMEPTEAAVKDPLAAVSRVCPANILGVKWKLQNVDHALTLADVIRWPECARHIPMPERNRRLRVVGF